MKFSSGYSWFKGRAKGSVYTFDLPAGWTCPGASECLTRRDRKTGRLLFGEHASWTCYAATAERFPTVRESHWANLEALRGLTCAEMTRALLTALPTAARWVRIHGSGDFFSQGYFDAWLAVAAARPEVSFWAFTKSLPFWTSRLGRVPQNLVLQASTGGQHDALIAAHGLKRAQMCHTQADLIASGLPLDTDDELAIRGDASFALLIRGGKPGEKRASP